MNFKDSIFELKIQAVADILCFGYAWSEDYEVPYGRDVAEDSAAHIAACMICQYFSDEYPLAGRGVDTVETRDYFFQGGLGPREDVPQKVKDYLNNFFV